MRALLVTLVLVAGCYYTPPPPPPPPPPTRTVPPPPLPVPFVPVPPRGGSVSFGTPQILGYDKDLANGTVLAGKPGLQGCYDAALKASSTVQGTVTVKWNLNGRGEPHNVQKVTSTAPASLDTCVMAQVLAWRFPKPRGGISQITYPFVFTRAP